MESNGIHFIYCNRDNQHKRDTIKIMNRFRLASAFCEPSILSAALAVFGSILILILTNLSFLINSGLFYEALLGKGSSIDLIQSSHDTLTSFSDLTLGNTIFNKILFFGFWMMVGLLVYASIISISHVFGEVEQDVQSMHYLHTRKRFVEQRALLRFALRGAALLGFMLLSWVMLRVLLPFCILSVRVGLNQLSQPSGWGYCVLGFAVLTLCLHLYAIIFRLLTLKPRVFGNLE